MKRIATIVILVVVIGAAFYTYKIYTGKVRSLKEIEAEANITATGLIAAFEKDSAAANRHYLGKVIEVTGTIKSIEKESGTIVMGNAESMSSVRCSVDTNFVKKINGLNINDEISIKGACTGYNSDDLGLGSDVVLNRCVIPAYKN